MRARLGTYKSLCKAIPAINTLPRCPTPPTRPPPPLWEEEGPDKPHPPRVLPSDLDVERLATSVPNPLSGEDLDAEGPATGLPNPLPGEGEVEEGSLPSHHPSQPTRSHSSTTLEDATLEDATASSTSAPAIAGALTGAGTWEGAASARDFI